VRDPSRPTRDFPQKRKTRPANFSKKGKNHVAGLFGASVTVSLTLSVTEYNP
jgi:hypothetical protein